METVSEITNKKKRGRPSKLNKGTDRMSIIKMIYPHVKTARGRQNKIYLNEAVGAISAHPDPKLFSFLWELETDTCKSTILAELGRYHSSNIIDLATEICEKRMKSVEAVAFIRREMGVTKFIESKLELNLINTINTYIRCNPACTYDEIQGALRIVSVMFSPNLVHE